MNRALELAARLETYAENFRALNGDDTSGTALAREAASLIRSQSEALRPIAIESEEWAGWDDTDLVIGAGPDYYGKMTVGDLRRARSVHGGDDG